MINKVKSSRSDVPSLNPQSSILNPLQDLKENTRSSTHSIQHRTNLPGSLSFNAQDEKAMQVFGERLSRCIPSVLTCFLEGELGAGKTTLVRAFIQAIDPHQTVKSPTFTLVEPYVIEDLFIYHFDLFRMKNPQELDFIGASDYFGTGICFVEWPEKGGSYLPRPDLIIHIDITTDDQREVCLSSHSVAGETVINELKRLH